MDRERIREEVRSALKRALGETGGHAAAEASGTPRSRPGDFITEKDLEARLRRGEPLDYPAGTRFTPLARETLDRHQRRPGGSAPDPAPSGPRDAVAVGADHGGFAMKESLREYLTGRGFAVIDCGTDSDAACDYPVFARAVAQEVASGRAAAGIVVDGAGIGSAMTANKVPGIRAAQCHNVVEARNAREHNHAHVLTLGSGIIGLSLARAIVDAFLSTPFGEGRHARRVGLIEGSPEGARG